MSQSARDLQALRVDLPASLELRRLAAGLIAEGVRDERIGC